MSYQIYSFTVGVDTVNQIDVSALQSYITTQVNVEPIGITLTNNVLQIIYASALSPSEETSLSTSLSTYIYTEPTLYEYLNNPLYVLDQSVSIINSSIEINNTTN